MHYLLVTVTGNSGDWEIRTILNTIHTILFIFEEITLDLKTTNYIKGQGIFLGTFSFKCATTKNMLLQMEKMGQTDEKSTNRFHLAKVMNKSTTSPGR